MDEMNNKNELDWYPTANTSESTQSNETESVSVASAASEFSNDAGSFANNDDPNGNNTYYSYQPNDNNVQNPSVAPDNSAAVAKAKKSMIMGIIAAASVTSCFCFPVGIILGIIAIVNATRAKKLSVTGRMPGMAIPGLICGIYALAMSAFWLIYFGIFALVIIVGGIDGDFAGEVYLGLSKLF